MVRFYHMLMLECIFNKNHSYDWCYTCRMSMCEKDEGGGGAGDVNRLTITNTLYTIYFYTLHTTFAILCGEFSKIVFISMRYVCMF